MGRLGMLQREPLVSQWSPYGGGLGEPDRHRLVVVAPVERGDLIRIISARLASRHERKTYEEES
jgi:hypothetical protein